MPAIQVGRVIPNTPAQLCDDEVSWEKVQGRLRAHRRIRLRNADDAEARQASKEVTPPTAPVEPDFDANEDEGEPDQDYYAGFGENSHYDIDQYC